MKFFKHFLVVFLVGFMFNSCEDEEVSFVLQEISAPTQVDAVFDISDDDTGTVTVTPTAVGASTFEIFFGDVADETPTAAAPGETVAHIYTEEGDFTLRIVAIGATGLTSELSRVVNISFTPPTNLAFDIAVSDTNPFEITVSPTADDATVFDVFFGDVDDEVPTTIMAGETATKIYAEVGDYEVRVVARGASADTIELTQTVSITGASDPIELPITFDVLTVNYAFSTFNGASYELVENPDLSGANPDASQVGAVTNSGNPFEGGAFNLGTPVDFSGNDKLITMKFWSNVAVPVLFKFEGGVNGERDTEVIVDHGGTGWEDMTFDFANDAIKSFIDGDPENFEPFVPTGQYATIVIIVDGPGTTAGTFYMDDIDQMASDTGGTGPELLINGDFEAGAEPWNAGVEEFGAPPAPVVTENGNTFYSVNIDSPDPSQPFLVNLSQQGLSITADANYILTFDAWSDRDRTIIAGLGESSGGFASSTLDVNLTAQMQTFTMNLNATGFGGDDIRVLFDSNAEAGLVNIDNVSLVAGGDGSNTVTSSGGGDMMPMELLINGDFEAGAEPWNAGVEEFGAPPAPVVTENGNTFYSVNIDNPNPAEPFAVNLSQQGLTIVANGNYILTFDAWSDRDRTIIAGLGESSGGFASSTVNVNISAQMQTFTVNLNATGFGGDDIRVLFDSNAEAGLVNIDNVSLVEGGDGSNTVTGGNNDGDNGGGGDDMMAMELLINGDFEAGAEPWNSGVEEFGAPPAPVVTENGNTFYSVNIDNPNPAEPFAVNLSQQGLSITAGGNYILTFDAWSDRDRTIIAGIGESSGGFASSTVNANLTAQMQTFTVNLNATGFGGDDIRVLFDNNAEAGLVNIDNVSLVEGGDGSNTITVN